MFASCFKQVVVLCNNDYTRIHLGGLSIGCLRPGYRGGCLNMFDCNALS